MNRKKWLKEMGVKEKDVLWDEDAQEEYIMQEPFLMDEGEPENGKMVKIYLPNQITSEIKK